jgi:hypothetical protein
LALDRRLGTLDPALRPGRVEIELVAAPGRFEARPEHGVLVVSRAELGAGATVWLHELAHLRAAGPRPRAGAGAHLALAVDEAFADYFAAAVSGEPLVGSGHAAARDLSRAPNVRASEWALLGFSRFDPHRFGWALAGAFWRREPRAGALLADLAVCLSGDALRQATTPADVLHALAERCPARSRSVITACLREWAPAEISARPDLGGRNL